MQVLSLEDSAFGQWQHLDVTSLSDSSCLVCPRAHTAPSMAEIWAAWQSLQPAWERSDT